MSKAMQTYVVVHNVKHSCSESVQNVLVLKLSKSQEYFSTAERPFKKACISGQLRNLLAVASQWTIELSCVKRKLPSGPHKAPWSTTSRPTKSGASPANGELFLSQ